MVNSNDVTNQGSDSSYWLSYSIQESEHESNSLTVDTEGNVMAQIQLTEMNYPPRALGWFFFTPGLDDPDIRLIGRLIRDKGLICGDIYDQPPSFGGRSVYFHIKADGLEVMHDLNPLEPLPEAFNDVEGVIERLFKRVEAGPLRTLSMDVSFEPPLIKAGDDLRILLEFRNNGRFTTKIRNPATFTAVNPSSLQINLWRKVKDKNGEMRYEYEATIDLADREFLVGERQAVSSIEQFLRIPTGETLLIWTTVRFQKLKPDTYTAEAVYYSEPMANGEQQKLPDLIVGEYHAEFKKLIVSRK